MRSGLQRVLLILVLCVAWGCGGSSKPPKSASEDKGGAQGSALQPVEEVDRSTLTAVPAPADLIAVMRLRTPATLTDTLGSWSNVTVDWRALLREAAGPVEQVVLLDAPVEVAAVLDSRSSSVPKVLYAFSLGLSSVSGARELLQAKGAEVTKAAPGLYRAHLGEIHCIIAVALGAAPARLVCSDKERALDELGPYMTRGLPGEALSQSALFAQFRAEPWRARFGRQIQMVNLAVPFVLRELELDHPSLDAALSDTLYALAEEVVLLANDLDALTIESTLDSRSESLGFSVSLTLKSQRSWFGQWLGEAERGMASAPPAFWTLPLAADEASYQAQTKGPKQEAFVLGLIKLIDGGLDYLGVPGKLKADTSSALQHFLKDAGASVYASGSVRAPGQPAPAAGSSEYHLMAVNEQAQFAQLLRQLFLVYTHPATRKALEAKVGAVDPWPALTSRKPAAGSGLPAASVVYELTLPPEMLRLFTQEKSEKAVALGKVFATTLNTAGQTWLAVALDEKVLSEQVSFLSAASPGATLTQNRKLDALREQRALGGGFVTLKGWLTTLQELMPSKPGLSARLQHGGAVPMLHRTTVSQGGKQMNAEISVSKPVFADLAGLILAAIAEGD